MRADAHGPQPYESPREEKPLTTISVVKRSIGAGVILLLTPVAVLVAGGLSCAAAVDYVDSSLSGENWGDVMLVAWSIFLLPPVAVLIGMIWWAVRSRKSPAESK